MRPRSRRVLQLLAERVQGVVEPGPGRTVRYAELARDHRRGAPAIEGLHQHRMVLVETFYRGGTTAMVARQLGIPHGTARSRLHYALHALREQLQDPARSGPHEAAA